MGVNVDSAYSATVLVDAGGIVTGWSEPAQKLLGWTAAEAVGRPATEFLTPEVSALLAVPGASGPAMAVTLRTREGEPQEAELTAYAWLDGDGRAGDIVVTVLPGGSARRQKDMEVVERAFDQCPFVLAIYDENLTYWRLNKAATAATRLEQEKVRGKPVQQVTMSAKVREELIEHRREAMRTGEPVRHMTLARLPGEDHVHAWAHSVWPVKDDEGQVKGVCSWGFDMSAEYWARERLTLLNEASSAIGRTLDVVRTARELTEVLVPGLADFAAVDLFPGVFRGDEGSPRPIRGPVTLRRAAQLSVADGNVRAGSQQTTTFPAESPAAVSLTTGRSQVHLLSEPGPALRFGFGPGLAADPAHWPPGMPVLDDSIGEDGVHSRITVPLRARGTLLGVAVIARATVPEPFTADDLILSEELAAKTAAAIDNARRYTRERATALTLQRSLLPRYLPARAAVQVASRYLPADSQAGVGGDWFDVIPLSGSRVALVVGDVVGHGILASATMGQLRTAVRTLADVDLPPDELLTHLDDLVIHLTDDEQAGGRTEDDQAVRGELGATCLYAVYDPVTRRCSMATAGHPLPVVVTPAGIATPVHGRIGPPLGIGGLPFEATELELPTGSVLALFTDGLIESRDRDIDQSLSALCHALERPVPTLEAACDAVTDALLDGRATDDVALLLARTRTLSPEQVATWEIPAEAAMVERARKDALQQLSTWGLTEVGFVTELVVSELVTNAIRHGAPPVQLRLIRDRNLICEVSDGSSTAPHMRRARGLDEGGRGLLLVAQLTQDWGTRQTTTGKTIWCEQSLPTA